MGKMFYQPNVDSWKYIDGKRPGSTVVGASRKSNTISEEEMGDTVKKGKSFFDWTLSFTKTIVQVAFLLFVFMNIFFVAVICVDYYKNGMLNYIDLLINQVYGMFVNVIGGYIIKSATENSIKIAFSVISQYLETKYGVSGSPGGPDHQIIQQVILSEEGESDESTGIQYAEDDLEYLEEDDPGDPDTAFYDEDDEEFDDMYEELESKPVE